MFGSPSPEDRPSGADRNDDPLGDPDHPSSSAAGLATPSLDHLRLAMEAGHVGVWEVSPADGRCRLSPNTPRIVGWAPGDVPTTTDELLQRVHPSDRVGVRRDLFRLLRGHDAPTRLELRIILPDGTTRWIEARGHLVEGASGQPVATGTFHDITETKWAELTRRIRDTQATQLARQARILEQTQRVARVGGFEWDSSSGTGYWTDEMFRLRGVDPRSFDPNRDDFWIGFGARERVAIRQALARDEEAEPALPLLLPLRHPESGVRWVSVVIRAMKGEEATPLAPGDDIPGSYYGAITDVTERTEEVELLKRVAHLISTGTGTAFLQAVTWDLAETFGADEAFVARLLPDREEGGPRLGTLTRWTRGGRHDPVEYPVAGTPCGTVVEGSLLLLPEGARERYPHGIQVRETVCDAYAGAPLVGSGGQVMGILGVLSATPMELPESAPSLLQIFAARAAAELERMKTEEALAQKELELNQSQKMEAIGKLAGGIAHDFNNILTVINGSAELALTDPQDAEEVQRSLVEIYRSGKRAAELTRHLLAFARKQVLSPTELDPGTVVEDSHRLLDRLLGDRIQFRTRLGHEGALVHVDPIQLERALINLALNARDAMPDGGTLYIATSLVEFKEERRVHQQVQPPGRYLRIAVTDTGSGMTPEIQARIFEPFFSTKPVGSGTGLGLPSVYGIVRQSGGFISVESVPGEGSTFHIDLPPVANGEPPPDPPARGGDRWTVLLIRRTGESSAEGTRRILEEHGLHVIPARSVQEARQILDRPGLPIQLVITDRLEEGQVHLGLRGPENPPVLLLLPPGDMGPRAGSLFPHRFDLLHRPVSPEQLARRALQLIDARMAGNR